MNFLERATALVNRGFSVIPLTPRGKTPLVGATGRTNNAQLLEAWGQLYPEANVGVCADENITILESDDAPRLRSLLKQMDVDIPLTLTGGSRENRPHWFYLRTPECGDSCLVVPGLFEFRNFNQYVAGPGSVHPDGHEYKFWNNSAITPISTQLLDALRQLAAGYKGEARSEHIQPGPYVALRNAYLEHLDPADLLTIKDLAVDEGERHYTLMSLAGLLHDG
jgi:hypothetical protein